MFDKCCHWKTKSSVDVDMIENRRMWCVKIIGLINVAPEPQTTLDNSFYSHVLPKSNKLRPA